MAPKPFSNASFYREQDLAFYEPKFPKEHVESLVIGLERIALDSDIPWSYPNETHYAYDIMITELYNKFDVSYTFEAVEKVVAKLHERHEVFSKLLNSPDLQYDIVKNHFIPSNDKVWSKFHEVSSPFY